MVARDDWIPQAESETALLARDSRARASVQVWHLFRADPFGNRR